MVLDVCIVIANRIKQTNRFCIQLINYNLIDQQVKMHRLLKNTILNLSTIKYTRSHVIGVNDGRRIDKTVATVLNQITHKYPDAYALHSYSQNVSFTYQQLLTDAQKLANGFIEAGLKPQDRLGLYSYNNYQWYLVQLASALANLILVNINPAYQAEELAYTLNKVECKALVTSTQFKSSNYLDILNSLIPELKNANSKQVQCKRFPNLKRIIKISDQPSPGMDNLKNYFISGNNRFPDSKPQDAANIQFTSGTTGSPKACTLSHINIINNAFMIGDNCKYTNNDIICIPVPLYHCFGMIMGNLAALTRGATAVYVGEGFDTKKTLEAVSKYRATSLYGVPAMFIQYLKEYEKDTSKYDLSKLRTGIMAGSLCPEILMRRVIKQLNMTDFTICYGMTETSPVSFQTHPDDTLVQKTQTVGRILPRLQAKIVNDDNQIVPVNTPGQIIVKGESVMIGYWGDKAATQKSIVDGFMKTGDLGILDQDGFVCIVGRIKDMIIRGGENIYPKEIEDYLRHLKSVLDVQVIGYPDQKNGEEVFALIKLNENAQLTRKEVYDHCHKKIAHYKIPKYVKFVDSFPLTVSGKPQKYKMKQALLQQEKQSPEQFRQYLVKKQ